MHRDHSEILVVAKRLAEPSVTHTTFGGFCRWYTTGTASFEVLVSPPSPGSVGWAVGLSSRLSKTPSGTGVQFDALMESSSATELLARGTCCSSRAVKVLFQLPHVEEVSCEPGLVAATFSADLFDNQLGVSLHEELADP
jgi:hypothetical protein